MKEGGQGRSSCMSGGVPEMLSSGRRVIACLAAILLSCVSGIVSKGLQRTWGCIDENW